MKIYILAAVLMLATVPSYAEWSKSYEVDYAMGDGDNKTSARQAALEQIKLKASAEAGTYIQSTTTMQENGDLTQNVQMLSATMVKIGNAEEKLTVNQTGQAVLQVTAIASLDDGELFRRVQMLQKDKEKERQVKRLQAENEQLNKELARIRSALAINKDPASTASLLSMQNTTIKRIEDNGNTITKVFSRGTLLQMASQDSVDFEKAKRDLDDNFLNVILNSKISAEIESVEASGNGYAALVRVGWDVDTKKLYPVVQRYLTLSSLKNGGISATSYENTNGSGPNKLSDRVYTYLATRGIDLKLNIGRKEVRLPVFYSVADSTFGGCGSYGAIRKSDVRILCLVSHKADDTSVRSTSNTYSAVSNPVRISLSKEEADEATRVDAVLVEEEHPIPNKVYAR